MNKQLLKKREEREKPSSNAGISSTVVAVGNASALQLFRENNVIQMRDDRAQILTAQVGTDPAGPEFLHLGMSAHHVIPAGLLERFYSFCNGIADSTVRKQFDEWKKTAKKSTEQTGAIRVDFDGEDFQASSAQWMAGNIFVGPIANRRIDDKHDETTFDYAVKRKAEYSKALPAERKETTRIEELEKAYNMLIELFGEPEAKRAGRIILIRNILTILTKVAADTTTIHNPNPDKESPAYDVSDWFSVGGNAITGMVDYHQEFSEFCCLYKTYSESHYGLIEKQENFKKTFMKYIDLDNIGNLENQMWTISRYNYSMLKVAYLSATIRSSGKNKRTAGE